MIGYWFRHRLVFSFLMAILLGTITAILFAYPTVKRSAQLYDEQSVYNNSKIDFIVPEPSYAQIDELPGQNGIDKIFPFYITKTEVKTPDTSRTTTVLLSDQMDNIDITMYNDNRLIEKSKKSIENPAFVDWQFCKDSNAKLGDTITITVGEELVNYTIAAIYETNTIYDGGAILIGINPSQKRAISDTSKNNGYSAMYVTAENYDECSRFFMNDYRPLGRLKSEKQFDSKEQYDIHYDAIMSSSYSNEITDFRVKSSEVSTKQSSVLIFLGTIISVVIIIAFNLVMFNRGTEKGYFERYCITRGLNVKQYIYMSLIVESILGILCYVILNLLLIRNSNIYISANAIGLREAIIPIGIVVAEVFSLCYLLLVVKLMEKKERRR